MTQGDTATGKHRRRSVRWAVDTPEQQMDGLVTGDIGHISIQDHFLTPPLPDLQTMAAYQIRRMSFENQAFGGMSNERSYLLENLQRQHDRGQRLTHALYNVETRLASAQSKGAARKLRKEAGLLKSKIAESNKQEQLVVMRLNDLQSRDSSRLYQIQQPGPLPYPYSPVQPWGQAVLSPLTPLTPVSPLTPLPPGIYHPSPIPPSPLELSFLLTSPILLYNFGVPHQQEPHLEGEHQELYVPEQHGAATLVKAEETRRKSVEYRAARAFDSVSPGQENIGRRWSMADTFSPSPRDKRMSMPGLQTIWRY